MRNALNNTKKSKISFLVQRATKKAQILGLFTFPSYVQITHFRGLTTKLRQFEIVAFFKKYACKDISCFVRVILFSEAKTCDPVIYRLSHTVLLVLTIISPCCQSFKNCAAGYSRRELFIKT